MAIISDVSDFLGLSEGNMTGLSPDEVRKNISNFKGAMSIIEFYLGSAVDYLYNELYYVWASPKAVEFNKYRDNYANVAELVSTGQFEISQNAYRSYNAMARANGLEEITDSFGNSLDNNNNLGNMSSMCRPLESLELLAEKNGLVGMNTLQVPNIRDAFINKIDEVLAKIDEVPSHIALFDPDGAIQSAFSDSIAKMKENVSTLVSEMKDAINTALETEENNLRLAAKPMDAGYTSTNA